MRHSDLTTALTDRTAKTFLGILFGAVLIVALLNLLVPAESGLHVSSYTVSLLGKYLCYALLALALDLVWGYCGILSLGHGAFFALGGYAMGMYLMRQIGDRGVYGHPTLPDFMVFLNWEELPWYWHGFDSFGFAMLMVALVPGVLAFVFGWLAFRSRVTGVYLSIITQALTYALMLAFFRNELGFGGNNGLTDFKDILGFSLREDSTRVALLVASAVALGGAFVLSRWITGTRLGRTATLYGAVIGAILVNYGKTVFTGVMPEAWLFALGGLFVAVTVFLPQGLVGLAKSLLKRKRQPDAAEKEADHEPA
jgi:urea transport system permease protein